MAKRAVLVAVVGLLGTSAVHAQPSSDPTPPEAEPDEAIGEQLAAQAREAARAGQCESARALALRAGQADEAYRGVALEPIIATCQPPPARVITIPVEPEGDLVEPALSPRMIAVEAAGGVLVGALGLVAGFAIADRIDCGQDGCPEVENAPLFSRAELYGALVGWTLGIPLGIYAVGALNGESGSLLVTYGASAGCLALGVIGFAADNAAGDGLGILAFIAAPVVTVAAYNMTRDPIRRSSPPQIGSIVQVDDGVPSFGMPIPMRIGDATGFSLASGSF